MNALAIGDNADHRRASRDTKSLLERASEIDPQAWASPLPARMDARRSRSYAKAAEEAETTEWPVNPGADDPMKLSAKKLAKMKRDAEHVQKLRDMGAQGNVAYVFVDPKDLLELLRVYQTT